jgi:hypothetical protein
MDIHQLKARYPRLYSEIFAQGVQSERRRALAADLIANANPSEAHPAVFTLGRNQKAPQGQIWLKPNRLVLEAKLIARFPGSLSSRDDRRGHTC